MPSHREPSCRQVALLYSAYHGGRELQRRLGALPPHEPLPEGKVEPLLAVLRKTRRALARYRQLSEPTVRPADNAAALALLTEAVAALQEVSDGWHEYWTIDPRVPHPGYDAPVS